jgi:hypothetical protein
MSVLTPETDGTPAAEPEAAELDLQLTANFCAKGNHGPCQGMVYELGGPSPAVRSCECKCHAGKTVRRARNQW